MSAPAPLMGPGAHTAYADSFAAGAAEIAALLAEPPAWLDTAAPHDLVLSPMKPDVQRGRITATKYAWRWECQVRGPAGSPYAGRSYRVLVRLPVGFPRTPAKLQVLSTIVHDVVEVRDPYEGQLDESFYERLAERVETEGGAATDSGDGGGEGEGSGSDGLRFRIGTRVRCKIGAFAWESGRVIDTHYAEPSWPAGEMVPYQVRLDDGRLIYAPSDEDEVIQREKSEAAGRGGGPGAHVHGHSHGDYECCGQEHDNASHAPHASSMCGAFGDAFKDGAQAVAHAVVACIDPAGALPQTPYYKLYASLASQNSKTPPRASAVR